MASAIFLFAKYLLASYFFSGLTNYRESFSSINSHQRYLRIPEKSRELFSFQKGNEKLAPHSVTFSLHFKPDIRPLTRIRTAQSGGVQINRRARSQYKSVGQQ
jgi:hypothetical protein